MKISISVPAENQIANHGYGVATDGMIRSLVALGHEVVFRDPTAPVEINFIQPVNWEWSNPNAYHIGYVPWESTRLPAGWEEAMKAADEIWTTSPWCKWVFEKHGFADVKVYMHGVDTLTEDGWTRKRRRLEDDRPVRFLHMGEPASRKGGQLVYDIFNELFGSDPEGPTLTIKAHKHNTVRGVEPIEIGTDGNLYVNPDNRKANVKLITGDMDTFQLVDLIHRHDVLVYPSWGEGFGLIPLQAMVTGMPVICTGAWAAYQHLLVPELKLSSRLVRSPWPDVHPGNMYEPNADELRAMLLTLAHPADFDIFSIKAYGASFQVEKEFDWLTLTKRAWAHIVEKFETE